jgi:hypothetical protein
MTKPVFFEPLIKVTVVPTFKQNALLDLASGKSGVAVAELPLRLIPMVHGVDAEPHVFAAVQMLAGLEVVQTSPLIFFFVSLPAIKLVRRSGTTKRQQSTTR